MCAGKFDTFENYSNWFVPLLWSIDVLKINWKKAGKNQHHCSIAVRDFFFLVW